MLLEQGGNTSEEEEQALGSFRELPPEVSGTKHRWLKMLKTQQFYFKV